MRSSNYISEVRLQAQKLWQAYEALRSFQDEWNALDYGNTLADGADSNSGITAANIGSVIFDTTNAIKTVMDAGSATNIARLL